MKELIDEKLKKDEQKLINAIHENYRNKRMENEIDNQLEKIAKKESQFSKLERERKKNILLKIVLAVAIIAIIVLGIKYNEKQIKSCMEVGNSEEFCRYAGE